MTRRRRDETVAERQFAAHSRELTSLGLRERFQRIYETNLWSDPETRSGVGSSLDSTRALRAALPGALRQLDTHVLLDVPCGDFSWMQQVELGSIAYVGGDIVPGIVAADEHRWGSANRRFVQLDLTRDRLPYADVLLCRDCLVHLSYANIRAVFANVIRSGLRYVLMTSFPGRGDNEDVEDGDWRPLDFEAAPFNLPAPVLTIVEECEEEGGAYSDKSLCAWRVSDLGGA